MPDRDLLAQAAQSRWVNEEILTFKRLGRENRIFCLIVDGEPGVRDPALRTRSAFPPALISSWARTGELTRTRSEPIAADVRPGKDGELDAKLKLHRRACSASASTSSSSARRIAGSAA